MLNIDKALNLDKEEDIIEQINIRKELCSKMVGSLYPPF